MGNPRNTNGHRRRELRKRHLANPGYCKWEQCPWPDEPLDPRLPYLDPKEPVVDEIVPVSMGGSPTEWANTRLLHRYCNSKRGNGTRAARTVQPPTSFPTSRAW